MAQAVAVAQEEQAAKAPFTIDKLADKAPVWSEQIGAWIMFLPTPGKIISNVNVRVDAAGELSIDEYAQMSKIQFSELEWTILSETIGPTEWAVRYEGKLAGTSYRWYARAVIVRGKVILATATCAPERWEADGIRLINCVDSMKARAP